MCETCSRSTIETPERLSIVFIVYFEHISQTSSFSDVNFEELNDCWHPPYQFINPEITNCCN